MSCKFCGRLFSRGFNLRRHENEYCPLRNQNISNSQESDIDHSLHMDRKRKHTESDDSVSPSSGDDQASNTPESTDYETEPEDELDPPKKARHAESDDVSISSHDESSEKGETVDETDDGEDEFDPWEELIDIAKEKVDAECEELLQEFRSKGFDEQDAITKAAEQISPRLREELQKTYLKRMVWMNELKKDETHRKIMKTRKAFIDEDDFDPGEALAAAIEKRKFLFGKLLNESRCPNSDEDSN